MASDVEWGTTFADLYHHFVEPHLREERDNWDNLSHGPTYSEEGIEEKLEEEEWRYENLQTVLREAEDDASPEDEEDDEAPKYDDDDIELNEEEEREKRRTDFKHEIKRKYRELKKEKDMDWAQDSERDSWEEEHEGSMQSHNIKEIIESEVKKKKLTKFEKDAWKSFENCRELCEKDKKCFQFVFFENTCKLGHSFRLGNYMAPDRDGEVVWKSGWMMGKIRKFQEGNVCKGPEWPEWAFNV
ncbi:hypothetical protein G7Y89_g9929 [Cudoniella acicularis]|uniref:Apple domain-containing protein n=1 Tax=Cudoniella acicularis TaxID=354080 RepID=A0A8H4RDP9_9HELO|nr:hypothetical protein G7Y89_g9929 [Cudoniella acicularis]